MNTQNTQKIDHTFPCICTIFILVGILLIGIGVKTEYNLTFSVDTLKTNIEHDIARIQSFFSPLVEEDVGTSNHELLYEIKALSGAEEDDRVLYALKSGETWFLNTREKDLYYIAYFFRNNHINSNEYTIVKDAHDLVCEKAEYADHLLDHLQPNDDTQHSYGALCLEEGAVCAAYAKAMVFLCRAADVQASYITGYAINGEPHGWVLVKIGDNYYHSDPCWDDDKSGISYDYFLLSDKEIEETRTWERILYPACSESFNFLNCN